MNPPSPWIGSMTTAARFSAPTSFSIEVIARAAANSPSVARSLDSSPSRYGYDSGARYTSGAKGPKPLL